MKLTLSEAAEATGGRVIGAATRAPITAISTDSRTLTRDAWFVALRGDRFDGHDHVRGAIERGAAGVIVAASAVERLSGDALRDDTPCLVVHDTLAALGDLAAAHRRRLLQPVVAVTGSNGKTTTKELLTQVLSSRMRGSGSVKSFNNAVGVPLTLLAARADDAFLVVEIGSNAPGEVAHLAAIVQPTHAIITSISEEHLAGFGDLQGVAREETAVLDALPQGAYAAVNVDTPAIQPFLDAHRERLDVATFALDAPADLRPREVDLKFDHATFTATGGDTVFRTPLPGRHQVSNALGVIAVARRLGLHDSEIAGALARCSGPPQRSELLRLGDVMLMNDAYNANPASLQAAIAWLKAAPSAYRRVAVIGEMLELGERAAALHAEAAAWLAEAGCAEIHLVGAAGRWMAPVLEACDAEVHQHADATEAAAACVHRVRSGDVVLLKGSRGVGLEVVAERFTSMLGAEANQRESGSQHAV